MAQVNTKTGEVLNEEQVIQLQLNMIAEFQSEIDVLRMQEEEMIAQILTPELLQQVQDVREEFAGKAETAQAKIKALENAVKEQCLALGKTVQADHFQVVWSKGRAGSWDGKALAGYAVNHPEILQFKNEDGKPSASLRRR